MARPIRVLIVEDSLFIQKILARIIESDPELQVVGVARNGRQGVEMARKLRPTSSPWTSGCRSWTASRPPRPS